MQVSVHGLRHAAALRNEKLQGARGAEVGGAAPGDDVHKYHVAYRGIAVVSI